jgi:hypothetical protein
VTEAAAHDVGDRVARLWLATMQEVARRSAHDVKNALNGAAVNLEVVRSRLGRPGATGEGAARFAETASEQLERVTEYAEALLALVRPPRQPTDAAALLRDLLPLVEVAAGDGARPARNSLQPGSYFSRVDAQTTRLALAAALLAAASGGGPVRCRSDADDGGAVRMRFAGGDPGESAAPELDPEIAEVAAHAGILVGRDDDELILTFPPLAR